MSSGISGKNIWYIHPYAGGPGVGVHYRPFEICRSWIENHGANARILMPSFHHSVTGGKSLPKFFRIGSVPYHTVPVHRYSGNGILRVAQMLLFAARLPPFSGSLMAEQSLPNPDIVIGSSPHPFCASAAARVARSTGARFVFEIRDLWPLSLTELGLAPAWHPFIHWLRAHERKALASANLVASVLPKADQYLKEQGWAKKPFVWAPNGCRRGEPPKNSGRSQPAEKVLKTLLDWKKQGRICMVYTGSMGSPNGLKRLCEALADDLFLPWRDKLGVALVGSGAEGQELRRGSPRAKIPVVWSEDAVPPSDIDRILQHADFAYAGVCHVPNLYRFGVSLNKVPEYMANGLPVILPCQPCGDPISRAGAGLVEEAPDPRSLARLICRMARLSKKDLASMGKRGKTYVLKHYGYQAIAKEYGKALASLKG